MLAKAEGPTALRAELIRALAFSEGKLERPGDAEPVDSVAALASVWNGRKGYVALLVRDVDPARIERWVTENTITSEEALAEATEEAIGFAESLGFAMDNAEFVKLSAFERDQRMHRWNKLRKIRKPTAEIEPEGVSSPVLDIPEPPPLVDVAPDLEPDIALEELAVPAPPPAPDLDTSSASSAADLADPPSDPEAETSLLSQTTAAQPSAVLGRISLVRKGGVDARRNEQLARLLAFF
jgi:hypothetical protein